jgi:hypothetical protein
LKKFARFISNNLKKKFGEIKFNIKVRAMMTNCSSGSISEGGVTGAITGGVEFLLGKNQYTRQDAWKTAEKIEEIHAQHEWGKQGQS